MIDPSDLLRRAAELTERADQEEDVETANGLTAHPPSVASLTNVLTPKSD